MNEMKDSHQLLEGDQSVTNLQRPASPGVIVTAPPLPPPFSSYGVETGDDQEVHFLNYWRAVQKRLPLILGVTALVTMLAIIYNARKPDLYTAQAQVQVDLESSSTPFTSGSKNNSIVVATNPVNDPAYINTQLQILTGQNLLRRVVKALDLEHNPKFLGTPKQKHSTWKSLLRMFGFSIIEDRDATKNQATATTPSVVMSDGNLNAQDDIAELKRLEPYVRFLQDGLKVDPVKETRQQYKETRLIDINFTHTDPQFAADVVNAVADTFTTINQERRTSSNISTNKFLQQRIAELQAQIKSDEEKSLSYLKGNNILSPSGGEQDVEVARLVALNGQLVAAANDRKTAEARLQAVRANNAADMLAESDSKGGMGGQIATIREQLISLKTKREQMRVEMTDENPEVKQVSNQIAELERQLTQTATRAKNSTMTALETEYEQAKHHEDKLRADFNVQRGRVLVQNEAAVQYKLIQQGIETSKAQLASLMTSEKDSQVIAASTKNNIFVNEHALAPDYPIGPQRLRSVLLVALFALASGVGLALFLDYLDNTVRSVEDVEKTLRLPLLSVIPSANELSGRRRLMLTADSNGNGNRQQENLVGVDSRSPLAESYRQLRTSVMLSTAGRAPRTLLVTSSLPAEGKTITATNIAKSLGQTGARVLIIDADMRRPRQHSIFGMTNKEGLSTYLSSDKTDEELNALVKLHEASGLFVLTSGPVPPNPAELLGSDQMRRLLSVVEKSFTHVVIDSPPITSFTDGVLISSMVDGVLLVVHGGRTSRDMVRRSRQLLQDVGARIFGVVLNNVNLRSSSYYYQSYYQSYYGEASQENEDADLTSKVGM